MKKKIEDDDDEEKRRSSQKSMMSRISDSFSFRSRKRSSVTQAKELTGLGLDTSGPQKVTLRVRDWVLALAEFCSAFCWSSYIARAQSEQVLEMRGMTPRDEVKERLLWTGCAAFGNLLLGHFSDAYAGIYTILMLNVSTQFTLGALFLMSEVINDSADEDEYGLLLSQIYVWSFIPIKSTEFAREVYSLQQLAVKDNSLILYFSYIVLMSAVLGKFAYLITSMTDISPQLLTFLVFCANGVVLYFYAYILTPPRIQSDWGSRNANDIWSCIFTALKTRRKFGNSLKKKSWLDYAEIRYEKALINKAKSLLKLFSLILPTAGFLLFTTSEDVIFSTFWKSVNLSAELGLEFFLSESGWLSAMLSMEFIFIPLLTSMGIKFDFLKRFVFGYVALLVSLFYTGVALSFIEQIHQEHNIGRLRIFNARRTNVNLQAADKYASWNFTVYPDSSADVNYHVDSPTLMRILIRFDNKTKYVTHLGAKPAEMLGYILFDPADIVRIRGEIPLREGPPGQNDAVMARCYAVSFMRNKRKTSITLRSLDDDELQDIEILDVIPGEKRIFQIDPGMYSISLAGTSTVIEVEMEVGGVYGIFMFADLHDYRLAFDKVISVQRHSQFFIMGSAIPYALSLSVALVALHAFVFANAPSGLLGISVGFLKFVELSTSWVLLLGFLTWHPYLDAPALIIYSFGATAFFFICLVLQMKYKQAYAM